MAPQVMNTKKEIEIRMKEQVFLLSMVEESKQQMLVVITDKIVSLVLLLKVINCVD